MSTKHYTSVERENARGRKGGGERGLNSTKWMDPESSGDAPFYRYGMRRHLGLGMLNC